ncbi:MAG: FHA domain-containing protein, partial [Myxococcota bacterium]
MGTIRLIHGTLERTLPHHFLVGRSDACDLRLGNPYVSSQHAVVHWNGKVWMVRDLASRNGTYLDGQRLDPGLDHRLQVEDRLSFGDRDEPWTISDDDEPVLMAVHASSSQARVGRESILALPDEAGLEVSIYLDQDGRWKMEGAEERGPHPVVDRQRVVTSKGAWIIHLPGLSEHTPVARSQLSFDTVGFRFAVRKQDERVRMTLLTPYVEQELAERE